MTAAGRLLVAVVLAVVLTSSLALAVGAAAVYRAGSIHVDVGGDSGGVSLRVPAAVTHVALALVPDAVLQEVSRELAPYWPPLRAAGNELARLPDFTLLEVDGRSEHVTVSKRGDTIVIDVDSAGERVRVELPVDTLERLVARLPAGV